MPTLEIALLVKPSTVKALTALHDNVDDKLIVPVLVRVQDMYIQPLLGSTLFKKLLADTAANTLSGNYQVLVEDYLLNVVSNYVLADLSTDLNAQFWNKGVASKQSEGGTAIGGQDLKLIISKYRDTAEFYANRCKKYLQQYATQYYPEYYQLTPGIDTMIPQTNQWSCPFATDGTVSNVKPHAYYND